MSSNSKALEQISLKRVINMCYLNGLYIILKCCILALEFCFMNNSFDGIFFSLSRILEKEKETEIEKKGHCIFIYFLTCNFWNLYGVPFGVLWAQGYNLTLLTKFGRQLLTVTF